MFITRKYLRELGASDYQVRQLTKNLNPAKKKGNTYLYEELTILKAIDKRIKNQKIRKPTLRILQALRNKIKISSNEVAVSQNLLDASQELSLTLTEFKKIVREGREISKNIKKEHTKSKKWNRSHPEPGVNNIVSVSNYKLA